MYLVATISKMLLEGGKICWTISSDQYVKSAVDNVEEILDRYVRSLISKCVTPFSRNYYPYLE